MKEKVELVVKMKTDATLIVVKGPLPNCFELLTTLSQIVVHSCYFPVRAIDLR